VKAKFAGFTLPKTLCRECYCDFLDRLSTYSGELKRWEAIEHDQAVLLLHLTRGADCASANRS
jgi:hypothetical protein